MTVQHHHNLVEEAPGIWRPLRPARDTSWWHRWKRERACRRQLGHCYHPEMDTLTGLFCCACGREEEGMPPQRCLVCTGKAAGEAFAAGVAGGRP